METCDYHTGYAQVVNEFFEMAKEKERQNEIVPFLQKLSQEDKKLVGDARFHYRCADNYRIVRMNGKACQKLKQKRYPPFWHLSSQFVADNARPVSITMAMEVPDQVTFTKYGEASLIRPTKTP